MPPAEKIGKTEEKLKNMEFLIIINSSTNILQRANTEKIIENAAHNWQRGA